jgi:hypothetical protein
VETVLGLSVTASHVQTVLIEGRDAGGATLEHENFEVFTPDVSVAEASERVADVVGSIAEAAGHQLCTIAVTWSEDADLEAALVIDALAESGLGQRIPVVAVGARQATEALARSIGAVLGYQRTAVCVVEPEAALLALIDTAAGDAATVSARAVRSADALVDWAGSVFTDEDWHPEGLFLVGSIGGLSGLADRLATEVGIPVVNPPGAELALAHGAALASGTSTITHPGAARSDSGTRATRRGAVLPLTMMTAGAAAIVVSTALLVSPAMLPDQPPLAARESVQVNDSVPTPAHPHPAAKPPTASPQPLTAPTKSAEAVVPEPLVADVPAGVPTEAPQFAVQAAPEAPVPPAPAVDIPAAVPVVEAPAPVFPAPPPAVAPPVPQVPYVQPRLRDRIRDRIGGGLARIGVGQ